jgi:hypothetical protein
MKICPRCQKTYPDDNLNFCLEDGTTLQQMSSAPPPPTVQMSQPPVTAPGQAAPSQPAWNTPQQYGGQPPKKSSKTWIWVLLILGVVALLCGGGVVLLAVIGYKSDQSSNTTYNSNFSTTTTNRNTLTLGNKTTSNTTSNSNTFSNSTRTSVTTLDLDIFESKEFNLYGTTEISGDELLVSSKQKDSYYVVVAPEKYTTEDADSRVTLHNTANSTSRFGYGLIFHSDPSPLQQDYAFLIDTARKKYRVVHHSPHNEDAVVNWTSSPAIIGGTGENTLEARDHSGKIDLYINGTMVQSIKNDFGFSGGVVGLYVGDASKVAFKDLEIRR